jgi:hypothetical protein
MGNRDAAFLLRPLRSVKGISRRDEISGFEEAEKVGHLHPAAAAGRLHHRQGEGQTPDVLGHVGLGLALRAADREAIATTSQSRRALTASSHFRA